MLYAHIVWSRIRICKSDLRDDCDSSCTLATSAITILFVALNTFLSVLLGGKHQVMLAAMACALARQHDSETAKYLEEAFALKCFDVCLLPWGCLIPFCSIVSDLDVENVFCFGIRDGGKILSVCFDAILCSLTIPSQLLDGSVVDVSSKKMNVVGRKRVEIDLRIKEGALKPHTNAIKPSLTDENKKSRLAFCLSMLSPSLSSGTPTFNDMFNIIHIDEKWFYMSRPSKRYYLVPGEEEPFRTCKSNKFITKVMFLAAVAWPRFDTSCNEIFSGKIGIFPLTTLEPEKRSSKNRVAGTMETKPILSVTKEVTRSWLIEKVLPAIRAKWPQGHTGPVFIQQDNAKPNIGVNDDEFLQEASRDGFDIRLHFQPPNSPDLNVLDLGFF
ncbi:hypothetical protein Tco_0307118 [Tanacetum coccineum]